MSDSDTSGSETAGEFVAGEDVAGEDAAYEDIARLAERYFRTQHGYDPLNATLLGLDDYDHLAGDPSQEASEAAAAAFAEIGAELGAMDAAVMTQEASQEHEVLTALVFGAGQDAAHSLWAANASAETYVSRQGLLFQTVPIMTVTNPDGADRYLSRLAGVGDMLTRLGERYRAEAASGRVPTALGVGNAVVQLDGHLKVDLESDALLTPTIGYGDEQVTRRARTIIDQQVRPAIVELARTLREDLLPVARSDELVGISTIHGGEEGYRDSLRRHTTTDLSPEEVHQIGLEVLDELAVRWREVGRRAIGETDFPTIARHMRTDRSLRCSSAAEIVAVAQGALDRAEAERREYFPSFDITDCVIEEINALDAENTALAYYRPPAVDGSRPGAFCTITTHPELRFKFEYEALAFHESVPGHHLQLASAQKLDIPRYRRYLDVEACSFNEGWGLYAEGFAEEAGWYSSDLDLLGMLSFLALRACRLVGDTGIHHFGWSRERAVQFMYENTVTTEEHVRSEVNRYVRWPAQATAYMIGRREILRLRAEAEHALGDKFRIRDFHGAVLGNGAIPMTALAKQVRRWSASVAGGSQ